MVKIVSDANPYVLDKVDSSTEKKKITALTKKNADFIKAVIRLDSNYGDDFVSKSPAKGYDPENAKSTNKKNRGSTAYWFYEMKKNGCDFKKCVLGAIISIDSTNSTHLEAAYFEKQDGTKVSCRKGMRDIICDKCSDYKDLLQMLDQPFDAKNPDHLISLLTEKTFQIKDGKPRYNISFATKFCAYASFFLGATIKYPKYDNVVSDALPKYEKIYLNRKKKLKEYKIDHNKAKTMSDDKNYQYRLDVYDKYSKTISEILKALKSDNINLTEEEFDHIVWYSMK